MYSADKPADLSRITKRHADQAGRRELQQETPKSAEKSANQRDEKETLEGRLMLSKLIQSLFKRWLTNQ